MLPIETLAKTVVTSAHSLFVETVLPVIEELVPIMKFGKRKVDKERRILLRRLGKVRKRLATTKSIPRATSLLLSQQKLEKELMMSHDTPGFEDENKVVNAMKVSPKAFFAYGRARQKTMARVGPFLDPEIGAPNPV